MLQQVMTKKNNLFFNKAEQDRIWNNFCMQTMPKTMSAPVTSKSPRYKPHPSSVRSETSAITNDSDASSRKLDMWGSDVNLDLASEIYKQAILNTKSSEFNRLKSAAGVGDTSVCSQSKNRKAADKSQVNIPVKVLYEKTEVKKSFPPRKVAAERKTRSAGEPLKSTRAARNNHVNVEQKMKGVINKICALLEDASEEILQDVTLPDGDIDVERRKKRAVEFCSRFSRNYLYQIGRDITEFEKLATTNKTKNSVGTHQKLITAHHTIVQGLQFFRNHLPVTMVELIAPKVRELLSHAMKLCDVHRSSLTVDENNPHTKRLGLIMSFESKVGELLAKIEENCNNPTECILLRSKSTRMSVSVPKSERAPKIPARKSKSLKGRLSMYTEPPCFRKDHNWKYVTDSLSNKRLNVPSRYKTATFKHRPPQEKPHILRIPSKHKLFHKCSSGMVSTIIEGPVEDDVETMISLQIKDSEMRRIFNTESMLDTPKNGASEFQFKRAKSDQELHRHQQQQQQLSPQQQDRLGEMISGIMRIVQGDAGEGVGHRDDLETFLGLLQKALPAANNPNPPPQLAPSSCAAGSRDGGKENVPPPNSPAAAAAVTREEVSGAVSCRNRNRWTITETGERNARLICIRDESSIQGDEDTRTCTPQTPGETPQRQPTANKTDDDDAVCKNNSTPETRRKKEERGGDEPPVQKNKDEKRVFIHRLRRDDLVPVQLLPKDYAVSIIRYKLEFHKHTRNNHMYRKSCSVKPWLFLGKIADEILDEAFGSLVKEIEIDGMLESLYKSEFQ